MKDMVYANSDIDINRTKKIFDGIKEACYTFDLSEPIWLDSNIADFQRHSKVRFTKDNFIDFNIIMKERISHDNKKKKKKILKK